MNRKQFMFTLSQGLEQLGQSAVQDILTDFDDHFRNGLEAGQSEDEITNELGNPADIARQYLDESADILLRDSRPVIEPVTRIVGTSGPAPSAGQVDSQTVTPAVGQTAGQAAGQPIGQTVRQPEGQAASRDGMLIAVILLNIFIGVPIWITLFATLSGFWAAAAGIGVTACVLFALAIFETGITSLILLLFGLAQTALTILAIILMVFLTKWLINGLRAYIRWSRKLVRGGAAA